MKRHFSTVAAQFARRGSTLTAPQAAARPSCRPQPPPAQTVVEDRHSQVAPATRKRVWWTLVLVVAILLVASHLADKWISLYRSPIGASYNSRLAELDRKLSRALARQLRTAGYEFDSVIVSVEGPACQRAVCLVKEVYRDDPINVRNRIAVRHTGNGWWSFAGMGALAKLKFDVDATAEMRRLAESIPPRVPPVALAALTPNQPKADAASPFARECEVWLSAVAEGTQRQWLDFETARYLTEPDGDYFDDPGAYLEWCRTNSADLSAVSYPDHSYTLFTGPMAVLPVESELWKQATPDDIIAYPSKLRYHFFSPADDQADTYLFRTKDGAFGILRLLEFNPASRQLRIQYKLARPGAKADTHAREPQTAYRRAVPYFSFSAHTTPGLQGGLPPDTGHTRATHTLTATEHPHAEQLGAAGAEAAAAHDAEPPREVRHRHPHRPARRGGCWGLGAQKILEKIEAKRLWISPLINRGFQTWMDPARARRPICAGAGAGIRLTDRK